MAFLLTPPLLVAVAATMTAILIMFVAIRRSNASCWLLAAMGLLYMVFASIIAILHLG